MEIILYVAYGIIVVWAIAWAWAFFRVSSDTLHGMISSGVFTLKGLGWSLLCALLALLPLFIALFFLSEFQATFPG